MDSRTKYSLYCIAVSIVSVFLFVSAMSDFAYVFGASSPILIIIIVVTIIIISSIFLGLNFYVKKKAWIFNEKAKYACSQCGSKIKLEEKVCKQCGAENIKRIEALKQLEVLEISTEVRREELAQKIQSSILPSGRKKPSRIKNLEKQEWDMLDIRLQKIKKRKAILADADIIWQKRIVK